MMSTKLTIIASLLVTTVALSGCQTDVVETQQTVAYERTNHISQAVYEVEFNAADMFSHRAQSLVTSMEGLCEGTIVVESVQRQWHETMVSWMALQGQERGPDDALEQSWNIQFWPDKKNTTGRKMSDLIKQPEAATSEQIALSSVTVQGLGALEWLLYDNSSDLLTEANTCQTAIAVSRNLAKNADKIALAWQNNPWVELDETHWNSEYVALLSNQIEYSMKKMSRPLANFGKPRPYFAESWRSETSMLNLKANIEAMQKIYFANGQGLDATLRQRGKPQLADSISNQFSMMLDTWPVEESLFSLLQTKQGYRTAYSQYNKLEQLNYLIHEEVAIELGVIIGFNATDGD